MNRAAWRTRIERDLVEDKQALALIASYDDDQLGQLMTNLGGHSIVIARDAEWESLGGIGDNRRAHLSTYLSELPLACAQGDRPHTPAALPQNFPVPASDNQAAQQAFGRILIDVAKNDTVFADIIVTTSPDVTVSTNLGDFVDQRGLFRRSELPDNARLVTLIDGSPSTLRWIGGARGQRVISPGSDRFGQTGDLADLYREYRLNSDAAIEAIAGAFVA